MEATADGIAEALHFGLFDVMEAGGGEEGIEFREGFVFMDGGEKGIEVGIGGEETGGGEDGVHGRDCALRARIRGGDQDLAGEMRLEKRGRAREAFCCQVWRVWMRWRA